MGAIRYYIDRASGPEAVYARYWNEVALVARDGAQAQDEKALSTTLLITPNFGLRNREFFEVCERGRRRGCVVYGGWSVWPCSCCFALGHVPYFSTLTHTRRGTR